MLAMPSDLYFPVDPLLQKQVHLPDANGLEVCLRDDFKQGLKRSLEAIWIDEPLDDWTPTREADVPEIL